MELVIVAESLVKRKSLTMIQSQTCCLLFYLVVFLLLSLYIPSIEAQILGESSASVHKCVHGKWNYFGIVYIFS